MSGDPNGGRSILAVTQGDPSGIGIEIAIAAWLRRGPATPPFFLLADADYVKDCAARLGASVPVRVMQTGEACGEVFPTALPVIALSRPVKGGPGRPDPADGPGVIEAIERGVEMVRKGTASALVTNPISKSALYQCGFAYPGHTEFLGELAERHFQRKARPVMMLWSPQLAVVPVTIHIPLERVFAELTTDLIVETGKIVARDLEDRFGVARPRLAISGLNPHAGEDGAMGRQEIELIEPAVRTLVESGVNTTGPLPADTMFHAAARARYDAALCMYHDQALIPIKTLAFESAVNLTLGLPFVRTSPDHGVAYDIAGRGVADGSSFEAALALAARLTTA